MIIETTFHIRDETTGKTEQTTRLYGVPESSAECAPSAFHLNISNLEKIDGTKATKYSLFWFGRKLWKQINPRQTEDILRDRFRDIMVTTTEAASKMAAVHEFLESKLLIRDGYVCSAVQEPVYRVSRGAIPHRVVLPDGPLTPYDFRCDEFELMYMAREALSGRKRTLPDKELQALYGKISILNPDAIQLPSFQNRAALNLEKYVQDQFLSMFGQKSVDELHGQLPPEWNAAVASICSTLYRTKELADRMYIPDDSTRLLVLRAIIQQFNR